MAALVALALLAASSLPLLADQLTCRQLEAELASAGRSNASTQYSKYDRAVTAQREQLDLARRQARDAGCGFSFLGGRTGCGRLNAQIDKMRRNLTSLRRTRAQLSSGSVPDRSRILADLDANGCRGGRTASRPRRDRDASANRASIFDQIFGGNSRRLDMPDDDYRRILNDSDDELPMAGRGDSGVRRILRDNGRIVIGGGNGDRYSTVCVRTCDGYFFPMSPASTTLEFGRDQKNCDSTCPGTDVQLYYRPNIGDDADTMISASSGEPYTDLPTAFRYKAVGAQRPPQCGCNPPKNYSVIGGNPPGNVEVIQTDPPAEARQHGETASPASRSIVTVPEPRPQANIEPTPDEDVDRTDKAGPRTARKAPHDVRVVGPTFLPDPAKAIDLRAPDRKSAR